MRVSLSVQLTPCDVISIYPCEHHVNFKRKLNLSLLSSPCAVVSISTNKLFEPFPSRVDARACLFRLHIFDIKTKPQKLRFIVSGFHQKLITFFAYNFPADTHLFVSHNSVIKSKVPNTRTSRLRNLKQRPKVKFGFVAENQSGISFYKEEYFKSPAWLEDFIELQCSNVSYQFVQIVVLPTHIKSNKSAITTVSNRKMFYHMDIVSNVKDALIIWHYLDNNKSSHFKLDSEVAYLSGETILSKWRVIFPLSLKRQNKHIIAFPGLFSKTACYLLPKNVDNTVIMAYDRFSSPLPERPAGKDNTSFGKLIDAKTTWITFHFKRFAANGY